MKNILYSFCLLLFLASSCEVKKKENTVKPEPHIELGQLATFMGCDPDRSYIIIGYRDELESKTEKFYHGQSYIVFLYINDLHDIKQAVIHKNSVIKR
jgi:hypothetical protein